MKSYDIWDTLLARRSVKDIHSEEGNIIPIAENIAKVGPDDIIVSDYYDEELLKMLFLIYTGLNNRVIVTEDGKNTGRIWSLLPGVTEHLDDNVNVLRKVHEAGIVRRFTNLSDFTKNENALLPTFPNLAKTMREARLRTWHPDPLQRQRQLLQIQANYPLLYCASLLLHRQLKDELVLMSSRDCYLWFQLMRLHGRDNVRYWSGGSGGEATMSSTLGTSSGGEFLEGGWKWEAIYLTHQAPLLHVPLVRIVDGRTEQELRASAPAHVAYRALQRRRRPDCIFSELDTHLA